MVHELSGVAVALIECGYHYQCRRPTTYPRSWFEPRAFDDSGGNLAHVAAIWGIDAALVPLQQRASKGFLLPLPHAPSLTFPVPLWLRWGGPR